jgi:hypothetical protein
MANIALACGCEYFGAIRARVMGFEIPATGRGLVLCSWDAAVGSHAVE